ncbi:MAG: alpha/beta hydrolase [Burkholderiaceae bacterium]|nr:alpha/beta hydrolase [Burkholderiaceae bacterium]
MRIYFATNRNPDRLDKPTGFGGHFSPSGLTDLRFGSAEVSGPGLDRYTLEVAPEKLDVGAAKASVGQLAGQVLGSQAVFEQVRAEMVAGQQDCMVFIHGFNVGFDEAISRTAQLKRFYGGRPMTWVLFTWPSDGSMLPFKAYASDRDDARASGVALGRGLQKLANFLHGSRPEDFCGQRVHLMTHSMGGYALRWALQSILGSTGSGLRRLLEHILMFAPDEDDDAFELAHKLRALPDMARRVSVYHNAGDLALVTSDVTKGNPDRLGAAGPRNSRALPDKVTVIDCEPVLSLRQDPKGHGYYALNTAVRRDVLAVLDGTAPLDVKGRQYQADTRTYRLRKG